jgi:hypothetical protein
VSDPFDTLTRKEAAALTRLSIDSLREQELLGRLTAIRPTGRPTGRVRYHRDELVALVQVTKPQRQVEAELRSLPKKPPRRCIECGEVFEHPVGQRGRPFQRCPRCRAKPKVVEIKEKAVTWSE